MLSERSRAQSNPRLASWEVLGAWLGIWTPPKGVEVPPRPSAKRVAVWAVAASIVIAAAYAVVAPQVNKSKRATAARTAREQARAATAEEARLRRDQRLRQAAIPTGVAPVAALEQAITGDTRQRVAR